MEARDDTVGAGVEEDVASTGTPGRLGTVGTPLDAACFCEGGRVWVHPWMQPVFAREAGYRGSR
jgi:hypothetical protein